MIHVQIRRIALGAAAVSLSGLTALILCLNACSMPVLPVDAPRETEHQQSQTAVWQWPGEVTGTKLLLHNLAIYDGPFYEDGTGREVLNVAAIVMENSGNTMISFAQLKLRTETGIYEFEAMMIPPHAKVLVPEKNATAYKDSVVLNCQGWTVDARDMPAYPITVMPMSIGTVRVLNLSDTPLADLHLYHRTYLAESDLFVGGVVFETVIPSIAAKSFTEVRPAYYAGGYSEIVYIG
jgi:hypothetical protein